MATGTIGTGEDGTGAVAVYTYETDDDYFLANDADGEGQDGWGWYGDADIKQQAIDLLGMIRNRNQRNGDGDANLLNRRRVAQAIILEGGVPETAMLAPFLQHPTFADITEYEDAVQETAAIVRAVFKKRIDPHTWIEDAMPYEADTRINIVDMVNRYYSGAVLDRFDKASVNCDLVPYRMGKLKLAIKHQRGTLK